MRHYFDRLKTQIVANWDKSALCDYEGEKFTFGELATEMAKLHILMKNLGISKGDKVALCGRNRARWGVSFLAINTYGAVVVPILADFHPDDIASIVTHSESRILFADKEIYAKLDKSRLTGIECAVSISDFSLMSEDTNDTAQAFVSVDKDFNAQYPEGFVKKIRGFMDATDIDYPTGNDKDLAVINYTSGSTGNPKGVMLRYECFSANVEYGQKRIPSYPEDNMLSILPMAHMFGMVFELIYPLCGGTTIYYLGRTPSPTLLLKAMQEVKPYLVIAVPMIFEKIYRGKLKPLASKKAVRLLMGTPLLKNIILKKMKNALDSAFGGNVRHYIMGGAAVNPEVEEFLHKIGLHFTVGYGMTEAAPLICYEDWDKFALHSCGKAIDSISIRIDSPSPETVAGEIQVKGINVFSGYYKNEEATKASFTEDGWFNTGDLGTIDKNGNLYIKGRSKSMLLSSNGQNIYPEEIECVLNSQPYVLESLVVAREGKLVGLIYLDEKKLLEDGVATLTVQLDVLNATNKKIPGYSHLSEIEVEKEPFIKTPKMSIKRFLYK